jgi:glycosyltransferase involved in cell wall biosynthesis
MNVLIITFDPPYGIGGIENRSRLYFKGLREKGHDAQILSFLPFPHNFTFKNAKNSQMTMPSSPLCLPLVLIRLLAISKSKKIQSILMLTGCLTVVGIGLLVYSRLTRLKSTVLLYGKDVLKAKERLSLEHFSLPIAVKLANKVAVNSKFTASLLGGKLEGKTVILYPCIDPDEMSIKSDNRSQNKHIIFVGRLIRRKGVDDLINAFSSVSVQFPDCYLDIVGDGPELENLKRLAKQLSLSDKVVFHGQLRGKRLYETISSSNLLVLPSKRSQEDVEGFGTVILEAAFYSIPAVGTYSGGIKEAIIDGVTGKLVPESNPKELSKAILQYLQNPELIRLHGEAARKRVMNEFTLSESVKLIISTFK